MEIIDNLYSLEITIEMQKLLMKEKVFSKFLK